MSINQSEMFHNITNIKSLVPLFFASQMRIWSPIFSRKALFFVKTNKVNKIFKKYKILCTRLNKCYII